MLNTNYNLLNFALVTDLNNFFKTKLPEIIQIKSIIDNSKILFNLTSNNIQLLCAEGERVYKFIILSPGVNKIPIGWFVYIPGQKRIDLYTPDSPLIPLIQWKNKKPVFKNYMPILDRAGLDKLFEKIINAG